MAAMKLTSLSLLLLVTLASGRCMHAGEFTLKGDSGIRLRGGTVYQFVGFPRGSGFRFIIHAHGPEGLSDVLHSLEDASTTSSDQDVSNGAASSDPKQAMAVGQDVQMMNAYNKPDTAFKQGIPMERAGEESSASSTQDFNSWILEDQANQAVRDAKTTLSVLYPFLFSHDFSSHMDRLMEARMRALSDLRNSYLSFQTEGEDGNGGSMAATLGNAGAMEETVDPTEAETKAEDDGMVVSSDDQFGNTLREAWEGAGDYTQGLWTSIVKAFNYAARWYTNASSEAIVAAAVIVLQAFLLIATFIMATVVICSRICTQEEPTSIILSAGHVPGVAAPLLSDRSDSEYSSDEEDGKAPVKYQPPKIES